MFEIKERINRLKEINRAETKLTDFLLSEILFLNARYDYNASNKFLKDFCWDFQIFHSGKS